MSKRPPKIDFDNNWKEAIEKHTYSAIEFFMPNLYHKLDTTQTPVFLEQEMRNLRRKTQKGRKKIMDKLIKVWLKTGEEQWVLIHIEVESSDKDGFNRRMYIYFARAYDKYDVPIVAMALLVGENPPPSYNLFEIKTENTHLRYSYDTYIVALQDEKKLLASKNIFALFILANLYTVQTKNDIPRRLELKMKIYELAEARKIPFETIKSFLTFVFEILPLPKKEAKIYDDFRLKKEKEMTTDAAFQKRRAKTQKNFADVYTKAFYDMYPSEMAETMKEQAEVVKEQAEALKEKDEALKEKDESIQKLIIYLHFQEKKKPEVIAALTEIPLGVIKTAILEYNKSLK